MAQSPPAWPPPRDPWGQQVSLEGGTEPRVAGQLASVGHSVRLVHSILCYLSDHCLLYGRSVKDFGLGDFWDWFMQSQFVGGIFRARTLSERRL